MKYSTYIAMVSNTFPSCNFEHMDNLRPPELIQKVAVELFLAGYSKSELVKETRKQLCSLRYDGYLAFDKERD